MFKPSFFYIIKQRSVQKDFLYEFYFKDKVVLDIGCGQGDFLKNNKEKIFGIDANETVVNKLAETGYWVKKNDVGNLEFGNGSFDAVNCRNVIEHLEILSARAMLTEIKRVLKPGGIAVLSSEMPTKKFWNTFGHVKPYPPAAIKKLLRKDSGEKFAEIDGLEILECFYFGDYYKNKLLYFLSVLVAFYLPILRREYFLVLKKNK